MPRNYPSSLVFVLFAGFLAIRCQWMRKWCSTCRRSASYGPSGSGPAEGRLPQQRMDRDHGRVRERPDPAACFGISDSPELSRRIGGSQGRSAIRDRSASVPGDFRSGARSTDPGPGAGRFRRRRNSRRRRRTSRAILLSPRPKQSRRANWTTTCRPKPEPRLRWQPRKPQ